MDEIQKTPSTVKKTPSTSIEEAMPQNDSTTRQLDRVSFFNYLVKPLSGDSKKHIDALTEQTYPDRSVSSRKVKTTKTPITKHKEKKATDNVDCLFEIGSIKQIFYAIHDDIEYLEVSVNQFKEIIKTDEINKNIDIIIDGINVIANKYDSLKTNDKFFDKQYLENTKTIFLKVEKSILFMKYKFLNAVLSNKFIDHKKHPNFISFFNLYKNDCFLFLFSIIHDQLQATEAYPILFCLIKSCTLENKLEGSFSLITYMQQEKTKIITLLEILKKDFLTMDNYVASKLDLLLFMYSAYMSIENYRMCNKLIYYFNFHKKLKQIILQESSILPKGDKIRYPVVVYENVNNMITYIIAYKTQDKKKLTTLASCFETIENFYLSVLEEAGKDEDVNIILDISTEDYTKLFNQKNIGETRLFIYNLLKEIEKIEDNFAMDHIRYIEKLQQISSCINIEKKANKKILEKILKKIENIELYNVDSYMNAIKIFVDKYNVTLLLLHYKHIVFIRQNITNPSELLGNINCLELPNSNLLEVIQQEQEINTKKDNFRTITVKSLWLNSREDQYSSKQDGVLVLPDEQDYSRFLLEEDMNITCLNTLVKFLYEHIKYSNCKVQENGEYKIKLSMKIFAMFTKMNIAYIEEKYPKRLTLINKKLRENSVLNAERYFSYLAVDYFLFYVNDLDIKLTENLFGFSATAVVKQIISLLDKNEISFVLKNPALALITKLYTRDDDFSHEFYKEMQQVSSRSILDQHLAILEHQAIENNDFQILLNIIIIYVLEGNYSKANIILETRLNTQADALDNSLLKSIKLKEHIITQELAISINNIESLIHKIITQYLEAIDIQDIVDIEKQYNPIDQMIKFMSNLIKVLRLDFQHQQSKLDKLFGNGTAKTIVTPQEAEAIKTISAIEISEYLQALNDLYNKVIHYIDIQDIKKIYSCQIKIPATLENIPSLSVIIPKDFKSMNLLKHITLVYLKLSNNLENTIDYLQNIKLLFEEKLPVEEVKQNKIIEGISVPQLKDSASAKDDSVTINDRSNTKKRRRSNKKTKAEEKDATQTTSEAKLEPQQNDAISMIVEAEGSIIAASIEKNDQSTTTIKTSKKGKKNRKANKKSEAQEDGKKHNQSNDQLAEVPATLKVKQNIATVVNLEQQPKAQITTETVVENKQSVEVEVAKEDIKHSTSEEKHDKSTEVSLVLPAKADSTDIIKIDERNNFILDLNNLILAEVASSVTVAVEDKLLEVTSTKKTTQITLNELAREIDLIDNDPIIHENFDLKIEKAIAEFNLIQQPDKIDRNLSKTINAFGYSVCIIFYDSFSTYAKDMQTESLTNSSNNVIVSHYDFYTSGSKAIKVIKTRKIKSIWPSNYIDIPLAIVDIQQTMPQMQPITEDEYLSLNQQSLGNKDLSLEGKRESISTFWDIRYDNSLKKEQIKDTDPYYYLSILITDKNYTIAEKNIILSMYWYDVADEYLILKFIYKLEVDNNYTFADKIKMLDTCWNYINTVYLPKDKKKINQTTYLSKVILNSDYTIIEKIQRLHLHTKLENFSVKEIFDHYNSIISDKDLKFIEKVKILNFYHDFSNEQGKLIVNTVIADLQIQSILDLFTSPKLLIPTYEFNELYTDDMCNYILFMCIDNLIIQQEKSIDSMFTKVSQTMLLFRDSAIEIIDGIETTKNIIKKLLVEYDESQSGFETFADTINGFYKKIEQMIAIATQAYQDYDEAYDRHIDQPSDDLLSKAYIRPSKPKKELLAKLQELKNMLN